MTTLTLTRNNRWLPTKATELSPARAVALLILSCALAACSGGSSGSSPTLSSNGNSPTLSSSGGSGGGGGSTGSTSSSSGGTDSSSSVDPECQSLTLPKIENCRVGGNGADKNDVVLPSQNCSKGAEIADSTTVGQITLNSGAELVVRDQDVQVPANLATTGININSGGSLLVGSAKCPIGTTNSRDSLTITFTGARPADCPATDTAATDKESCHSKGIVVNSGGTVHMYGIKGIPSRGGISWTYLAQPAGPAKYSATANVAASINPAGTPATGPNTLYLANDVQGGALSNGGWQVGDWIVVATTSFSPFESEFVKITAIAPHTPTAGEPWATVVTVSPGLQYYHFGGPNPYANDCGANPDVNCKTPGPKSYAGDASVNYGVDERAEVGLISRNIVLTSDADSTPSANAHWGGEVRVLANFTSVRFQGVELQKFGKEHLGSYPLHLHMDGNLTGKDLLMDADSVDHSYNKCVTVHMTSNAKISNVVCARIVGHIFYEEWSTEENISFTDNLGVGAMSNNFAVNNGASANNDDNSQQLIENYWWNGDNMVKPRGVLDYNGFKIANTDNVQNPSHGVCQVYDSLTTGKGQLYNGSLNNPPPGGDPPIWFLDPWQNKPKFTCPMPNAVYYEPASGFWITNLSAKLTGNSIAGCQGTGKAYWLAPAASSQFLPIGARYTGQPHGELVNNRGHGCESGIYSEGERTISLQPFGYQDGLHDATHQTVMNIVDGITLTRMRNRGIWLRPSFFLVRDARVATDRIGLSLVTSGGPDGNYPGEYSYLADSVVVGISQNNVDRFGNPNCYNSVIAPALAQVGGGAWGCLDQTAAQVGQPPAGADYINLGYPMPLAGYDLLGYMIYDGPALIFHDRFVHFRVNPTSTTGGLKNMLDTWDTDFLAKASNIPGGTYEGDAALGWFTSANPSAYPVLTASRNLSFTGVDLRHQVFTQAVNTGSFGDGDKNTAVYDVDGTLTGLTLANASNAQATHYFPISLNNLAFNATGYVAAGICSNSSIGSVDECHATGGLNSSLEGIATANMSPAEIGSLEFQEQAYLSQPVTFTRDDVDFVGSEPQPYHSSMTLTGRNGQGIWEPKVASGFGYTITAATGIPAISQIGLVDVAKPNISSINPFYVRVGICYTGTNNYRPAAASSFAITRGYQSWGGGGVVENNLPLRQYYNQLDGNMFGDNITPGNGYCWNLTNQNRLDETLCPSVGVSLAPGTSCSTNNGGCPSGTTCQTDKTNALVCINPTTTLTSASTIGDLLSPAPNATCSTNNGGCPAGTACQLNGAGAAMCLNPNLYYYDPTAGMLYFYVAQTEPNAVGESPLGNCFANNPNEPAFCPDKAGGFDSYYVCPAEGCIQYKVALTDPNYTPAASTCTPYPTYAQTAAPMDYHLALSGNPSSALCRTSALGNGNALYPHYTASQQPACNIDQP